MYFTLSFKLIPEGEEDVETLKSLMKWQSSAIRFAYNRLKEGMSSKETYRLLREKFPHLPTKYISSAIIKAGSIKEHEKVVFGGKKLFSKLCKNHLQGKEREKLKKQWRENRQCNVSIGSGDETDKGNRLIRFKRRRSLFTC